MAPHQRIAVVGAGIIGLSSAVLIQDRVPNVDITLIAEAFSPHTTGDGSAGFWHPYLLGDVPEELLRFWCEKTAQFLGDIYRTPEANDYGVGICSCFKLSSTSVEFPSYQDLFIEHRSMNEKELSLFPSRYKSGVFLTSYYVECTKLLPMFLKKFQKNGGKVIQKKIKHLGELSGKYDIVINCTGVGAGRLLLDSTLIPIRGQVFRVRAPWIKHCVLADEDFYILVNSDEVICGGTHQEGDWNTTVDPKDSRTIWEGCTKLIPSLKNAEIIREWVGLRPGRSTPRIEKETLNTSNGPLQVVHNYGHGGSGVTLFWGCAQQAVELLKDIIESSTKSHL